MSFFGSIGKFLGGVAKTGLSVVTHGISDKVIDAVKGLKGNAASKPPQVGAPTEQQQALLNKWEIPAAKVRVTETRNPGEGWRFGVDRGRSDNKRTRAMGKRKPNIAPSYDRAPRSPVGRSKAAKAPKMPKTKRKAPSSPAMKAMAARMSALAAEWRAAGGKDGTGQTFFEWKRGK